ncbi:hypothetical protein C8R44DRAFT_780773 [Mycena epipterygia]|nr:hypothetical protein C8R44DRAFT_780773 [Mycena epipterygia]
MSAGSFSVTGSAVALHPWWVALTEALLYPLNRGLPCVEPRRARYAKSLRRCLPLLDVPPDAPTDRHPNPGGVCC